MLLYFLDVFGVDESRYLADELHEDGHGVGAEEGEGDAEVGVVLQMFLDAFVDFVGDLTRKRRTAFSGRKRNILKISMNRVPKGMISTIASM
jgi:hypothetical protein